MVKDPEKGAAIRKFLIAYGGDMNKNRIRIINDKFYYRGSIGGLTFYEKYGKYQIRARTSLNAKRIRKDPAFKGSRESAERFKLGNKLASKLYRMVTEEKRVYSLFCFLKKRAIRLMRGGKTVEEAKEILVDYLKSFDLLRRIEQKQKQVQVQEQEQKQEHKARQQQDPEFLQFQNTTQTARAAECFSRKLLQDPAGSLLQDHSARLRPADVMFSGP